MEKCYAVSGLVCQSCADNLSQKLLALKNVSGVQVNLSEQTVIVEGTAWRLTLNRALKGTKFRIGEQLRMVADK